MEKADKNKKFSLMHVAGSIASLWLASGVAIWSCVADPWPEPDEKPRASADNAGGGEEEPDYSADTGGGVDAETDTVQTEWGDSDDETPPTNLDQVYCSASGPDGMVAVVGLSGSVLVYDQVVVVKGSQSFPVAVGSDGGFAARIPALPGDSVEVVVTAGGAETRVALTVADSGAQYVGSSIGGPSLMVDAAGENLVVHGDGEALMDGDLVIGANRQLSTGRAAVVLCGEYGCLFDLFIPGRSGDVIDFFLVTSGERAGRTDMQSTIAP